jgi:hypothetical protein
MNKTQKILVAIISLIILTFFVGTAQAQVCEGDYIIDGIDTNDDIETLSGCTEITGSLHIRETHLASLSGLENITSVGGGLLIYNNTALTNLCGLYNVNLGGCELVITDNTVLSMDTAYALETQLIYNTGFLCPYDSHIYNNNGSGLVACDNGCNASIEADTTVFDASGGRMEIEISSDCACELFSFWIRISSPFIRIELESGENQCPETFSFLILENQDFSSKEALIDITIVTEENPWRMHTRESFQIFQEGGRVDIDIKPNDCPNVLNRKSKGVIPIVIRGSEELDVSAIDPESIQLVRTGDAGLYDGEVTSFDWSFEDVATRFQGELCERIKLKKDEFTDLLLKFDNQEIFSSLGLDVYDGETITFKITGNLYEEFGGTTFSARDSVRIISKY